MSEKEEKKEIVLKNGSKIVDKDGPKIVGSDDLQKDQSIPQEEQPAPGKKCDTDIETVIDAVKIIKRELLRCDDRFHRANMVVTVMKDLLFNVVSYNLDILGTVKILEAELLEASKHALFMGTMEQMVKAAKKAEKARDERIAEDLTRLTQ